MLSQTLQVLEVDGFVLRIAHPVIPPYMEYYLTEQGIEVAHRVEELVNWLTGLKRILATFCMHKINMTNAKPINLLNQLVITLKW